MHLPICICRDVIDVFNKREDYDFDSHEFIAALKLSYPAAYYKALLSNLANRAVEEAFQQLHAEIGKFLSRNQNKLNIRSVGKHCSLNYKGTESQNEMWKKL